MIIHLNYLTNLLNLFLIFVYTVLININLEIKELKNLILFLIILNLLIKLYIWYNFNISKKKNLHVIIRTIFFNNRFIMLSIFIFSIITPAYMILQKDYLIIDLFIEKFSFLLIFLFALIGFYLEFFILESKLSK